MRLQSVLIWIVVAGLLAGLVAVTRSGGSTPAAARSDGRTTWTVPVDPARVASMARSLDGQPAGGAERTGPDRWLVRWTGADAEPRAWHADPGRVRAALRLLSTAEIIRTDEQSELTPRNTLRITEQDGRSVEIWFGDRAAGGQTPVVVLVKGPDGIAQQRVDGRIGSGIPDAMIRTDWTAWRDPTLFEATASGTNAIGVRFRDRSVRLERGGRGWRIAEPFEMDADGSEVERLIATLGAMQASSFADASGDDVTGLDEPLASIRVETGAGVRMMDVGRAGSDGLVYARLTDGDRTAVIRMPAEALSRVSAAAEAYVRRTPLGISPAEVGLVRLQDPRDETRFEATREAGQWQSGGDPVSPNQRDAIDRLLRVLASQPAARVMLAQSPDETTRGRLGTIICGTREGLPLAAFRLRAEDGPDGLRLIVAMDRGEAGELAWTIVSEEARAVIAWVGAMSAGG